MKYCTACGCQFTDDMSFCTQCGTPLTFAPNAAPNPGAVPPPPPPPPAQEASFSQGMNFDFDSNVGSPSTQKRYEYKVMSQKDKWFSGKFDPALLEQAINAYAQQGWRVIGCATADISGFGTTRQEFITLMEREV